MQNGREEVRKYVMHKMKIMSEHSKGVTKKESFGKISQKLSFFD